MKVTEAEKLFSTIEKHPLTIKVKADQAAEILVKRTAAVQSIEALKKEQAENLPKLQAILKAKEEKFKEAKVMLEKATNELRTAQAATFRENISFDSAIGTHEEILLSTYDPAIDETITFFRDKLDDFRKPGRISSRGMNVERNIFTDTKTLTTESNADAVHEAIIYCQNSIKLLEMLKLSPEFHIEVIQELKDELPSIEVYKEVSGKKPLPGSRGIDPRAFLKSDSQIDWELGKLNEKFKKVMGRK